MAGGRSFQLCAICMGHLILIKSIILKIDLKCKHGHSLSCSKHFSSPSASKLKIQMSACHERALCSPSASHPPLFSSDPMSKSYRYWKVNVFSEEAASFPAQGLWCRVVASVPRPRTNGLEFKAPLSYLPSESSFFKMQLLTPGSSWRLGAGQWDHPGLCQSCWSLRSPRSWI